MVPSRSSCTYRDWLLGHPSGYCGFIRQEWSSWRVNLTANCIWFQGSEWEKFCFLSPLCVNGVKTINLFVLRWTVQLSLLLMTLPLVVNKLLQVRIIKKKWTRYIMSNFVSHKYWWNWQTRIQKVSGICEKRNKKNYKAMLGNICIENWTWFTWTPDKCI